MPIAGYLRGYEYVCNLAAEILTAGLAAKVAELATRYGVDPGTIPPPGLISAEPQDARIELVSYPAVMVEGRTTLRPVASDIDDQGRVVILRPYNLRVYCFVRGYGFAAVETLTKRYLLAVEEVLFTDPAWADDARLDPLSLSDSLADPSVKPADERVLGAAFCDLAVTIEETYPGPAPLAEILNPPTVTAGALT